MSYHQLFAQVPEKTFKKLAIGMKEPTAPVTCQFSYQDLLAWEGGALGNVYLLLTERQARQLDAALNAETGLTLSFSPAQLRTMSKIESNSNRIRGPKTEPRSIRTAPGFVGIGFEPPAGPEAAPVRERPQDQPAAEDNIEDEEEELMPAPAAKQPKKKAVARNSNFAAKK